MKRLTGDQRLALLGLGAITAVTGAWWALALWPVQAAPEWLSRTRAVCFGASPGGLPDGGGWILLIGQPLGMLGFLLIVWGGLVRKSLRVVMTRPAGRLTVAAVAVATLAGIASAGVRVASVVGEAEYAVVGPSAAAYPRLDQVAPSLRLVDQAGNDFTLEALHGRTVLLTFAYAHCETVCPVVVQQTLAARDRTAQLGGTSQRATAAGQKPRASPSPASSDGPRGSDGAAIVVVVTLDPWRDTPLRLPSIARQWGLRADDFVLSGSVPAVVSVLESWNVPIVRDESTGMIEHPAVVYVIGRDGRIAFVAAGGTDLIAELLRRS